MTNETFRDVDTGHDSPINSALTPAQRRRKEEAFEARRVLDIGLAFDQFADRD